MVVGEPSLMGGEFGDEDERLITRLENTQYDASNSLSEHDTQGYSDSPLGPGGPGGPSWPGGPGQPGPDPPPQGSSAPPSQPQQPPDKKSPAVVSQ